MTLHLMPTGHARDHVMAVLARRNAEELKGDPYWCPRSPAGVRHFVRSDNPMLTGRCENCRGFVCFKTSGLTGGWRTCTVAQAARWGKYGRRS